MRPCLACGRPTPGSRCPTCPPSPGRAAERRAANYGHAHRTARTELAATLPAPCWYGCGKTLGPEDAWVAAHLRDGDPTSPRVVACPPCNEQNKQRP